MERAGSWQHDVEWLDQLPPEQREEFSVLLSVYDDMTLRKGNDSNVLAKTRVDSQHVRVFVVLDVPFQYPAHFPAIQLHCAEVSPEVLHDLQLKLQQYVGELHQLCIPLLMPVLLRAAEMIVHLPLALQSTHFACCVVCNARLVKEGKPKVAQPVKVNEESVECLVCHNQDVIILPSMVANLTKSCSFCMCEDNPIFEFECSCLSCVQCFQSLADLAVGSKSLRKNGRTRMWGVSCPNHPLVVVSDPRMMKLCDPRCFLRYNNFALEKSLEELHPFICPQPSCCAVPVFCNVTGGLLRCLHCRTFSCATCGSIPTECRCQSLAPIRNIEFAQIARYADIEQPPALTMYCAKQVRMLVISGDGRKQVVLDPFAEHWEKSLLDQISQQLSLFATDAPFFVFGGTILRPTRKLCCYGVYTGGILYAVECDSQRESKLRLDEIDLWNFRRSVAEEKIIWSEPPKDTKLCKRCPFCDRPVAHYRNHGCHHIGFEGSCCGRHWCYVCRSEWPCGKCSVFCDSKCDCPPCPDCRLLRPCNLCGGCERCIDRSTHDFQ